MVTGTLILGWGNPGRKDDGLGPAFVEEIGRCGLPGVHVDSDYQLQIENAAEVARHARVLFVDADRSGAEPFGCRKLAPSSEGLGFSSHSVSPGALLALTRELFDAEPEAWLLGIRGYAFDDFAEGLSPGARENLARALGFVRSAIEAGELREVVVSHSEGAGES